MVKPRYSTLIKILKQLIDCGDNDLACGSCSNKKCKNKIKHVFLKAEGK